MLFSSYKKNYKTTKDNTTMFIAVLFPVAKNKPSKNYPLTGERTNDDIFIRG